MSNELNTLHGTGVRRTDNEYNRITIVIQIKDGNDCISFLNWSIYTDTNRVTHDEPSGSTFISDREYFLGLSTDDSEKQTLIQLLKEKLPEDEATKAYKEVLQKMADQKDKVQPMVNTMKELQESFDRKSTKTLFFENLGVGTMILILALLLASAIGIHCLYKNDAAAQKKQISINETFKDAAEAIKGAYTMNKMPKAKTGNPKIDAIFEEMDVEITNLIEDADTIIEILGNETTELENSDEYTKAKERKDKAWKRVLKLAMYSMFAALTLVFISRCYNRQRRKDDLSIYDIKRRIHSYNS